MPDNNPFFISTEGTGITFGQIDDLVDFPHSGIIKALNQMTKGNFALKTTNGFNITQSSSDPIITVAAGNYYRDGRKYTSSQTTFNAAAFTATSDNSYYLIVVDSSNVVRLRVPTAVNRVAQFTAGDTIIAMLEYSSTTSNGARRVQFFTTEKAANTLSVGRDNSGYTESLEIFSNAGDVQIRAKESDKDIEFYANDGGVDTLSFFIDGSNSARVSGLKLANQLYIQEQSGAQSDTAALGQLWVKNETPNALFFTNDAGNDVRLTDGSSLAVTNELVRYGLTADETLSSASRYTFTSGDFTAYAANTNEVTFSGEDITLKGAGIFEVNLYGYFAADTANANLEFDLSIGDGNQSNRYAYYRNIINLNHVVRMAQFTTATIKTTGDTVIKLSGYMVWTGANLKLVNTGSSDPYSNNTPQYTGFTIRKVA